MQLFFFSIGIFCIIILDSLKTRLALTVSCQFWKLASKRKKDVNGRGFDNYTAREKYIVFICRLMAEVSCTAP
jgi:hypothetical protein